MARRILLRFERGGSVTATLREDRAPRTCRAVLASLPVENKVVHAMWAGEEIFFNEFPISGRLEYENSTNEVKPGDVAVISPQALPSLGKRHTAFCIFYGKSRPRKSVDQTVDVNVFAEIGEVEKIADIGKRIRMGGQEKIRIEEFL